MSACGEKLEIVDLKPQKLHTWNNSFEINTFKPSKSFDDVNVSMTPYTVIWSCKNGDDYSINRNISNGETAAANDGEGSRFCKSDKKKKD